jgi:ribosomal-protein-alanine N-acetyltransferase
MMILNMPERLETDRLILQRLRYEDAEEIFFSYASKPEATRFMSWPTHQSINDTHDFLKYAIHGWQTGKDYSFSIRLKDSNKFAGSFGILHDDGKVQFGYIFSPTYWGRGYATEVCMLMMQVLKKNPGIHRIGTYVDIDNTSSMNVLRKSGFFEEAKLTRWMRFPNQQNEPRDCVMFVLPLR